MHPSNTVQLFAVSQRFNGANDILQYCIEIMNYSPNDQLVRELPMIIKYHKKIVNVAVYPAMKQTAMMVSTRLMSRKLLTLKRDLWKFIFIDRARTHFFALFFCNDKLCLVSAAPLIIKISKKKNREQQRNTRNKHPEHRAPRKKNNSASSAVCLRRVSPLSAGIKLLVLLTAQFYLSLLPAHRHKHEFMESGELWWCLGFILITARRKRTLPPAVSYRRRTCSCRQQFVACPCSGDAAVRVLPAPYQPMMIQVLSARASSFPPLLQSVPAGFALAFCCSSRDLSCP